MSTQSAFLVISLEYRGDSGLRIRSLKRLWLRRLRFLFFFFFRGQCSLPRHNPKKAGFSPTPPPQLTLGIAGTPLVSGAIDGRRWSCCSDAGKARAKEGERPDRAHFRRKASRAPSASRASPRGITGAAAFSAQPAHTPPGASSGSPAPS